MFDLPKFILGIRPDLRRLFPAKQVGHRAKFINWLLGPGSREYASIYDGERPLFELSTKGHGIKGMLTLLQQTIWIQRPDVQQVFPLPRRYAEFLQWFYTHGLEEHRFWDLLSPEEKKLVMTLKEPWASRLRECVKPVRRPAKRIPISQRPFGVNVIGYTFGQLGIGEDARMAARALLAADIPMTMVNYPPGKDIPQNDRSMKAYVTKTGEFAVNLFCITAEEHGRFFAEQGRAQFRDRYTIGYWPWELGKWPEFWEQTLDLVDEVWVSTQHTFDALKPVCKKPLYVMPMAVEIGEIRKFSTRAKARRHFGLPETAKLFCFAFDLNSHSTRKNPEGCIKAFLKAFPRSSRTSGSGHSKDEVGLVIKVIKPARKNQAWEQLKAQAKKDSRIHIVEQTLPRPELLALYQVCDCFLSLHRAEGFGRGIAEALQLGLHVICTGYSGNVDFCEPPFADLVRYKLVKLQADDYVYAEGQVWAQPDLEHVTALMQNFVERPYSRSKQRWLQFSTAVVGKRYRKRLLQIQRLVQKESTIELAGNRL